MLSSSKGTFKKGLREENASVFELYVLTDTVEII